MRSYQCKTSHSILNADSATCDGFTVLEFDSESQHDHEDPAHTYSDGRCVRPERAHSSTLFGASIDVKFAASRKGSEMIETQNSLVSLMLWLVSVNGHLAGLGIIIKRLPFRPSLSLPAATEIMMVGGL